MLSLGIFMYECTDILQLCTYAVHLVTFSPYFYTSVADHLDRNPFTTHTNYTVWFQRINLSIPRAFMNTQLRTAEANTTLGSVVVTLSVGVGTRNHLLAGTTCVIVTRPRRSCVSESCKSVRMIYDPYTPLPAIFLNRAALAVIPLNPTAVATSTNMRTFSSRTTTGNVFIRRPPTVR